MLNWIFLGLIAVSVVTAAFNGTMPQVTKATIESADSAVTLAIKLIGQMALWLGFMGVLREAGLMRSIARALKPVMTRLFPDVPPEHPAMGAMIMNLAANMLGLGNAATPFGLKAMNELDKLNPHRGVATNAMALFLAINTSGVAVLALGAVAVRATLGSKDPAGILVPSLLATSLSTVVAIVVAKLTERLPLFAPQKHAEAAKPEPAKEPAKSIAGIEQAEEVAALRPPTSPVRMGIALLVGAAIAFALVRQFTHARVETARLELARQLLSDWLLPLLMVAIVLFGMGRHVKVYEVFVSSAKEGFQIAVVIIPFLVAILVAIGMLRASGAMEAFVAAIGPFTEAVGFPARALPMALIRPLSGSGALAVMTETMRNEGPDSFVGYLVSVLNGSMETTFYVLAVYCGSVQVRATRHTVVACLAADLAGIVGATLVCRLFFG
ncbi:MAG: nucleoside recognition domain-containing protein [Myxococcota bacterium]